MSELDDDNCENEQKSCRVLPENNDHGHIGLSVHLVTAELGDHLEELGEEMSDTNPSFGLVQAEYLEESC